MKVKQLIELLSQLDQEIEIFCYSEEEPLPAPGHQFRILDIDSIDVSEAAKLKGEDEVATFKFGKDTLAKKVAFINVLAQF